MSDIQADASHREIIFHNDEQTPQHFVIDLLHSVFDKQFVDAFRFAQAIEQDGMASCGSYPHAVASQLLDATRQRIEQAGYPLRVTSKVNGGHDLFDSRCKLCGDLLGVNRLSSRAS
jgi:ATP-dependent Clp protease adapter protein ClpS